jgi:hypothetical protein
MAAVAASSDPFKRCATDATSATAIEPTSERHDLVRFRPPSVGFIPNRPSISESKDWAGDALSRRSS